MLDIGFLELVLIGVVALIVIGPERLPDVARTAGRWVGRTRRFISNVKADIDRELRDEELRKALDRNANLDEIKKIIEDTRYTIEDEASEIQGHVVSARGDDPGRDSQNALLKEQEDDFENDTSGNHKDLGADEYDEPVVYGDKFNDNDKTGDEPVRRGERDDKSNG